MTGVKFIVAASATAIRPFWCGRANTEAPRAAARVDGWTPVDGFPPPFDREKKLCESRANCRQRVKSLGAMAGACHSPISAGRGGRPDCERGRCSAVLTCPAALAIQLFGWRHAIGLAPRWTDTVNGEQATENKGDREG